MRYALVTITALFLVMTQAKAITVEFLQASITPDSAGWLSGIACRNFDRIVHLDIGVDWPPNSLIVESSGSGRLNFWTGSDEFLFPRGSFSYLHGSYMIKGYFIARSGGTHQGVNSSDFEKIDDAQVMLSPGLSEMMVASSACVPR